MGVIIQLEELERKGDVSSETQNPHQRILTAALKQVTK